MEQIEKQNVVNKKGFRADFKITPEAPSPSVLHEVFETVRAIYIDQTLALSRQVRDALKITNTQWLIWSVTDFNHVPFPSATSLVWNAVKQWRELKLQAPATWADLWELTDQLYQSIPKGHGQYIHSYTLRSDGKLEVGLSCACLSARELAIDDLAWGSHCWDEQELNSVLSERFGQMNDAQVSDFVQDDLSLYNSSWQLWESGYEVDDFSEIPFPDADKLAFEDKVVIRIPKNASWAKLWLEVDKLIEQLELEDIELKDCAYDEGTKLITFFTESQEDAAVGVS